MKKWIDRFNGILLGLMFLSTFFQVLARNLFYIPSMWTEELARYLFVWIVFLGAATLMADEGHIKIDLLSVRLRGKPALWYRLSIRLSLMGFGVVFVWSSWLNVVNNWEFYAPSMDWFRQSYLYMGPFISGILMLWYLLANTVRDLFPSRFGTARTN